MVNVPRRQRKYGAVPRLMAIALAVAIFMSSRATEVLSYTASYYTVASCLREGTSGIMANGRRLVDGDLTCAMWGVPFGTRIRVTNINTGKSVIVTVTDRGPAKRLVKKGRVIDLSRAAFLSIAKLREGIIPIEYEILNRR